MSGFKRAVKSQARLRLAVSGLAGSGKTWTSLSVASHLVPGGKVAVIDTERGSASLYANRFLFDVLELARHGAADYIGAIELAASSGYDVIVIDSLSHAWIDSLERVDQTVERGGGNSFTAWRKVSPEHNRLVDAILSCPAHVIATMRSKVEYALQDNDKGKKEVKKLGLAPVQRSGVEYEFTIVGDLDLDHRMLISKSRADVIPVGELVDRPGEAFARRLASWLNDGTPIASAPAPVPPPPAAAPAVTTQPTALTAAVDNAFESFLRGIESAETQEALDMAIAAAGKPAKGTPQYQRAADAFVKRQDWIREQAKQGAA